MLSRIATVSLVRAFSTSTTPAVRSAAGKALIDRAGLSESELAEVVPANVSELAAVVESERRHLAVYANDVKGQLNDRIGINFEAEQAGKTLILQSIPDGSSNHKLGEVLVLASAGGLWNLLLGFPSYVSLVGVLGLGAVGGVWSYSNYLRRSSPRITEIFRTAEGKLQVHYLKPGSPFSSSPANFSVDSNSYSPVSFGSGIFNFLRKSNQTAWVKIDEKLFWYNANPQALRVNNHHLL